MSMWTTILYILKHNHLRLEIFCPNRDVLIRYIGNITIKCHNKSMGDNRDPIVVLHQEISTLPVSIASHTRCF